MKGIFMRCAIVILFVLISAGCAATPRKTVVPLPPQHENTPGQVYRKTQEVILIACQQRDVYVKLYSGVDHHRTMRTVKDNETVSIVEAADSGIRFEVQGCYGKVGDRFKISY